MDEIEPSAIKGEMENKEEEEETNNSANFKLLKERENNFGLQLKGSMHYQYGKK